MQNLIETNENLIVNLKQDHGVLISLYQSVLTASSNQDYNSLHLHLVDFCKRYSVHIKSEEAKVDDLLNFHIKDKSKAEKKVISDLLNEMKNVSAYIFSILRHSAHFPVTKGNILLFTEEFKQIGPLLKSRLEKERSVLYPIYLKMLETS